jgi:hypothetical protein
MAQVVELSDDELLLLVMSRRSDSIPEHQLVKAYELAMKESGLEHFASRPDGWTVEDYQSSRILSRKGHLYDPSMTYEAIQQGIVASLGAGRVVKAWFYPSCITGLTNVVFRGYQDPTANKLVRSPLHFPAEERLGDRMDDLMQWLREENVRMKYVDSGKY